MGAAGQAIARGHIRQETNTRRLVREALCTEKWTPRRRIVARTLLHESTVGHELAAMRQEGLVRKKPSADDKQVFVYQLVVGS